MTHKKLSIILLSLSTIGLISCGESNKPNSSNYSTTSLNQSSTTTNTTTIITSNNTSGSESSNITSTTTKSTTLSVETKFSEINSIEDLLSMKSGTNYKLMKDLDCSNVEWKLSNLVYSGIFDGNGHKISRMNVANANVSKKGLLFYQLVDAKIMNLTICNSSVSGNQEELGLIYGLAKNVDFINIELS